MKVIGVFLILNIGLILGQYTCPDGAEIYEWAIDEQGKIDVVEAHNKKRQMIMDGAVDGQPQGSNLKMLTYDEELGNKAQQVSEQCKMSHVIPDDSRWGVGQNIHIAWSTEETFDQDWASAVEDWWSEKDNYQYPDGSINGKEVLHYTQLVWANTEVVGCDFIMFYDNSQPKYPYAKMYTCNYGPAGNVEGEAPYEVA